MYVWFIPTGDHKGTVRNIEAGVFTQTVTSLSFKARWMFRMWWSLVGALFHSSTAQLGFKTAALE